VSCGSEGGKWDIQSVQASSGFVTKPLQTRYSSVQLHGSERGKRVQYQRVHISTEDENTCTLHGKDEIFKQISAVIYIFENRCLATGD